MNVTTEPEIAPVSLDCEKRVLAYMFFGNGRAMARYAKTLKPQHFADVFHRDIFKTLLKFYEKNPESFAPDAVACKELRKKYPKVLYDIPAMRLHEYEIGKNIDSQIRYFEAELHEQFVARGVQWVADQLTVQMRDTEMTPYEIFKKTVDEFERTTKFQNDKLPSFTDGSFELLESQNASVDKLHIGVTWLDEAGCLGRGENVVLAGTPGTGKSAFAIQCCVEAVRRGLKVIYFSLEMHTREVSQRCLQNGLRLRKENIHATAEVSQFIGEMESGMFIFGKETGRKSVSDMESIISSAQESHRIDMVAIDHMGHVQAKNSKGSAYEQASQKSNDIMQMAGTTGVCVLNLCQLNRGIENGKKPYPRHLRDSGRIEEDATSIIFLHVEAKDRTLEKSPIEFLIRKNRGGPEREINGWTFNKPIQRFEIKRNDGIDEWNQR